MQPTEFSKLAIQKTSILTTNFSAVSLTLWIVFTKLPFFVLQFNFVLCLIVHTPFFVFISNTFFLPGWLPQRDSLLRATIFCLLTSSKPKRATCWIPPINSTRTNHARVNQTANLNNFPSDIDKAYYGVLAESFHNHGNNCACGTLKLYLLSSTSSEVAKYAILMHSVDEEKVQK